MNALVIVVPALTLAAYATSLRLRARHRAAYTTPVLVSFALVILELAIFRIPFSAYGSAQWPLTSFIVPACAALGVTTYKHRVLLAAGWIPIVLSLSVGSAVAIGTSVVFSRVLGLPSDLAAIETMKSVTAPVALQLAALARIAPELVVAFVVATGIVGATLGPTLLSFVRVRDPLARGLALGAISHGIGTAQAASEAEVSGAASSVAMCVVAMALSLVGAPLLSLLQR